jgi:hypothetical protein
MPCLTSSVPASARTKLDIDEWTTAPDLPDPAGATLIDDWMAPSTNDPRPVRYFTGSS